MVKPIPDDMPQVIPHLIIRNASEAIEFYRRVFGATELMRMHGPDGKSIMHACIAIGNGRVFLVDENDWMKTCRSPQSLGGTSVVVHVYSENVDATLERAVKAGGRVTMPAADMFWGDRYGKFLDPFGHEWSIATHLKDMTPDEMRDAMMKAFAQPPA